MTSCSPSRGNRRRIDPPLAATSVPARERGQPSRPNFLIILYLPPVQLSTHMCNVAYLAGQVATGVVVPADLGSRLFQRPDLARIAFSRAKPYRQIPSWTITSPSTGFTRGSGQGDASHRLPQRFASGLPMSIQERSRVHQSTSPEVGEEMERIAGCPNRIGLARETESSSNAKP